jgi:hypothetical protein
VPPIRPRPQYTPERRRCSRVTVVARLRPKNTPHGGVGHRVFANVQDPQEFLALDTWETVEGLQQAFGDPETQREIGSLFDGQPEVTIWSPRDGWTTF